MILISVIQSPFSRAFLFRTKTALKSILYSIQYLYQKTNKKLTKRRYDGKNYHS